MKRMTRLDLMVALMWLAVFLQAGPATAQDKEKETGSKIFLNEDFAKSTAGDAPEGWTVTAPNPAIAPVFKVVDFPGGKSGKALLAAGNGRKECFGFIEHPVQLSSKDYRFKVRFKVEGIDDPNRHLTHGIFRYRQDQPH